MRGVLNLLSTLVALVAFLSVSASGVMGSSAASACLFDATPSVLGGATAAASSHHALHKSHLGTTRHKAAAPAPSPGGPGGPRFDCAACMAVLPNFPSIGPHELMPFMPEAQTFEPLFGVNPALDPPPPRAEKR